jgi:hypothetical protein
MLSSTSSFVVGCCHSGMGAILSEQLLRPCLLFGANYLDHHPRNRQRRFEDLRCTGRRRMSNLPSKIFDSGGDRFRPLGTGQGFDRWGQVNSQSRGGRGFDRDRSLVSIVGFRPRGTGQWSEVGWSGIAATVGRLLGTGQMVNYLDRHIWRETQSDIK